MARMASYGKVQLVKSTLRKPSQLQLPWSPKIEKRPSDTMIQHNPCRIFQLWLTKSLSTKIKVCMQLSVFAYTKVKINEPDVRVAKPTGIGDFCSHKALRKASCNGEALQVHNNIFQKKLSAIRNDNRSKVT